MSRIVARIAVENTTLQFDKLFSYLLPEQYAAVVRPGCRVMVPFGSGNRKRMGMVFSLAQEDGEGLKPIASVSDREPVLTEELLRLAEWIADRTFSTRYDAVKLLLPPGIGLNIVFEYSAASPLPEGWETLPEQTAQVVQLLSEKGGWMTQKQLETRFGSVSSELLQALCREGYLLQNEVAIRRTGDGTTKNVRLNPELYGEGLQPRRLTSNQRACVEFLKENGTVSVKELSYYTGVSPASITGLVSRGDLELFETPSFRNPYEGAERTASAEQITLSAAQEKVFRELLEETRSGYGISLLYGVTGSGKTEIFLKLMEETLREGRSVIVLVPEISLTPQTIAKFHRYFGSDVAVMHSGLSVAERMDEWKRVRSGLARIAVGTRSAVFAPFSSIGLIVIDEEQEHTYRSESSPRFHAREVAAFRAKEHNARLLLCSATPSVESYYAAEKGKYSLHTLSQRFGHTTLPEVTVVDMRTEREDGNITLFSEHLARGIEDRLAKGEQTILLYNRRGYRTRAVCGSCGEVLTCPSCSIALTYHSANDMLMCHYCGKSFHSRMHCPSCGGESIRFSGLGTQSISEELAQLFPQARILRMDADTTMRKFAHETLFEAFAAGEYDILVGTQMVAKGLNFPRVTLVGVLSADQTLYSDDYKAYERAFALLTQVVGRSGRGQRPGTAVIQTYTPENPVIALAAEQDYLSFYRDEISNRKIMLYPPFCSLCTVGFTGGSKEGTETAAKAFLELLRREITGSYPDMPIRVLGPSPSGIIKMFDKYRFKLIIKCRADDAFREMFRKVLTDFGKEKEYRLVSVSADMHSDGHF